MADRRAPGAENKYWTQGQGLQRGRDQFDVCAYGLAEISSTSAPTACRRSTRLLKGNIRAEQFFSTLWLCFRLLKKHSGSFAQ